MIKRNRRLGTVAALAMGLLVAGACDSGLTEVNENPNSPEVVPINNLLLGGIWDVLQNRGDRGYFSKWNQLYHAENWAQHVAQPIYNEEDQYLPRDGVEQNIWNETYYALKTLDVVKSLAEEAEAAGEDGDNIWAIAEIMSVFAFAMLTDYFGDVPYFETFELTTTGGEAFPAYDAQSVIYPDLIARLDGAENRIDAAEEIDFVDADPIYQGDMDGWEMFANSLQLRLAMRMSNAAAGAAQTAFEDAWASVIFTDVSEEATVDWQGIAPAANPVYEGIIYQGRTGDFRMSESLVDMLAGFNDPRLPIYADPAAADGAYRGLRNGLLPGEYVPSMGDSDFSWIGEYYLRSTTPSTLLSYAEVLFLGAEAAELGWNVGGATADQLYQDAITASMEALNIPAGAITTYLGQAEVGYTTGTYQGLDAIHVQKWMTLFLNGPEAISDLRRIDFDWTTDAGTTGSDLVPAENSQLAVGEWPERLPYPPDEELYNPDNYPGDSSITDPLWWAN